MNNGESIPLRMGQAVVRIGAITLLLAATVGLFLYAAGWLTPNALTPASMVDTFEYLNKVHPGFRRNHAKGVCVTGVFESSGQGQALSKALIFRAGHVPVVGRFAFANDQPYSGDSEKTVRSLAILFKQSDGQEWRTAMINIPVFLASTPQAFHDFMLASSPDPASGKINAALNAGIPGYASGNRVGDKVIGSHPFSSGFADSSYYGVNAFRFINEEGESTPIRWSVAPAQTFHAPGSNDTGRNFLFDTLVAQVHSKPLQWHLILTVGQAGDSTADATRIWPADRKQIDAGTLTITSIESEDTSPTRDINFDPLVLPDGIAPSDDPLLSARSAVYSQSFSRREREHKTPSAVSTKKFKVPMLTNVTRSQFALLLRILHWLMAASLLAMIFIGVSMISSLGNYHKLLSIHRPLGVLIFVLAAIRLVTRLATGSPAALPDMSPTEAFVAKASEALMYTLFFALPLVGWAMLSAGHYPITVFGSMHLPPILSADPAIYTMLRETHTLLAYLLFLTMLAHMTAVLFHTLILRDGLLNRMLPWRK